MKAMRFRRVFVVVALAILLALAAAVFAAFSDFGSSKEPIINGMRLRRYVAHGGSSDGQELARIGSEAIPWLIKGLEAEDSAFHTFKARGWTLLPIQWQQKWRNRSPIHPGALRTQCVMAVDVFGPEAAAATPELIQITKTDSNSFAEAVAFNALAQMANDSREAKAFLIDLLQNGQDPVKTRVAGGFFRAGFTPPEAVPLLIARLQHRAPDEQGTLPFNEMLALSAAGPQAAPAAPYLAQYLSSEGSGNALVALRATGAAAAVALPRLLEIYADSGEWGRRLRPSVCAVLAGLGIDGIRALPVLTNGLSDRNPVVRALAAAGIANITGDAEWAVPRLVGHLERPRSNADGERLSCYWPHLSLALNHRQLSAVLLGNLGPRATNALPNLERALSSSDSWLPVFAAEAIWKISKETNAILPSLIAGLKDRGADRRMLTLSVLAEMGPAAEPAIPAIREAMQSDLRVRRYGYVALQRINSTNK